MGLGKNRAWLAFYPAALSVAAVFSVSMTAWVTNVVLFESAGPSFGRELYLEHIRNEVERAIRPAIVLDCVILFLGYRFLPRLKRRSEIEEAVNFSVVTYVITFAVWLSYTMFHGLSGEYRLNALVVTLLALAGMLVCGVFFCMELRRLSKES